MTRAYARSGDEMTPPTTFKEHVKRTVLRKVIDQVRPLAYRRWERGIRCLTFHYMFEHERDHARRMFAALKREGDFITTNEMLRLLEDASHRSVHTQRLFHLSADDGFENIAQVAHPVLKELAIPYSLMVCPAYVGAAPADLDHFRRNAEYAKLLPLANWEQLKGLSSDGVEIGAHTLTHRDLSLLSGDELAHEIIAPKQLIEAHLGKPCVSFAWPFGRRSTITEEALRLAQAAGYRALFSSVRGTLQQGDKVPRYFPRHHFEPSWPLDTVLYYATRSEPPFATKSLGHG